MRCDAVLTLFLARRARSALCDLPTTDLAQRVRVLAQAKLGQSPVQNEAKHGDKEHQEKHFNVFLRRRGCGHASSLRRCSGEPRAQPARWPPKVALGDDLDPSAAIALK